MGKFKVTSFFYRDKPLIGLEISKTSMKLMSIDMSKMLVHGYSSVNFDSKEIPEGFEKNESYLRTKLDELFKKNLVGNLSSDRVVLCVPTSRAFVRAFSIPAKREAQIKNAVDLEAEQYIPMPLESLYMDYEIIKRDKNNLLVSMCAAPQALIDPILSVTRNYGIEVAMIEPSINSVARLLKKTEKGDLPTLVVDIGPVSTDIAILDGAIRVTGGLSVGGNTFTLSIAKKLNIPIESAHQLKVLSGLNTGPRQAKITSAIKPNLLKITSEVQKVMRYYTDRFSGEPQIEQILIVGSGSNVPGIGDFFTNELVMPVRTASPWQALNFGDLKQPSKQMRPRFITAAGAAIVKPSEVWS